MTALAAGSASIYAQPGTLGFLVVFGMGVILIFLFRSMSKHLRKVRAAALQEQTAALQEQAAKDPAHAGELPRDS